MRDYLSPVRLLVVGLVFTLSLTVGGSAQNLMTDTKIAFTGAPDGNNDILIMMPDGTGLVNLTNDPADDSWATWSDDGTQLAFQSNRTGDYEIWRMDVSFEGAPSNLVNLTNDSGPDRQPAWSPDGIEIAFYTDRTGNAEVYTMDADNGQNQLSITNLGGGSDETSPTWAPSMQWVAYIYANGPALRTVDIATGVHVDVIADATVSGAPFWSPDWSPGGTEIAYSASGGATDDVWATDPAGTARRNITNLATTEADQPSWSPDGTMIVFQHGTGTDAEIAIMNSDGTGSGLGILTDTTYEAADPDWSPFLTTRARHFCRT